MKKINVLAGIICFAFLDLSCDPIPETPRGEFETGVLIWNEGAFGANDGEVYHFDPEAGTMHPNVFERVNNRPFAGLIQDLVAHGDNLYLVANTGKVEVVDGKDFSSLGAVNGLDISRSAVVANNKLFISDWGPYNSSFQNPESYVAVVNQILGGSIAKKIPVSSRPEGMKVVGDRLLVACTAASRMDVLSVSQEAVISSIEVQGRPLRFFEKGGALYLFSRNAQQVFLSRINTSSFTVDAVTTIALPRSTGNFALGNQDDFYVLTSTGWPNFNDAVAKISFTTGQVTQAEFYTGSGFYGLGYHAGSKRLYLADNNGFQGNGTIILLNASTGQMTETHAAGRGPAGFLFR